MAVIVGPEAEVVVALLLGGDGSAGLIGYSGCGLLVFRYRLIDAKNDDVLDLPCPLDIKGVMKNKQDAPRRLRKVGRVLQS